MWYRPVTEFPNSAYIGIAVPTGHGNSIDRSWRGVITQDGWKYAVIEHQPWLLFNLNDDPYEQVNHAYNTRFKTKRRELHERLLQWAKQTGDDFAFPELE